MAALLSRSKWTDDSTVTNCISCNNQFTFFTRKHHCRMCGLIYCNTCSSYRIGVNGNDERTCLTCYKQYRQNKLKQSQHNSTNHSITEHINRLSIDNTNNNDNDKSVILYNTYALCSQCVITDKRNKHGKPAIVYTTNNCVYFKLQCSTHRTQPITLLCSNVAYWSKLINIDNIIKLNKQSHTVDIEELQSNKYQNKSLVVIELDLYKNSQLVPHSTIESQLYHIISRLDEYSSIVRLNVGLYSKQQLYDLHDILQYIYRITNKHTQLVYFVLCDYFRLFDLLQMNKSIFLYTQFYPCVQYYLCPGEESVFVQQMSHIITLCQQYDTIQLIVYITVFNELPNFEPIFSVIKQYKSIIRCVILTRESSPTELIDSIHNINNSAVIDTDIYKLLECIDNDTKHQLQPDDYVPLSLANIITPIISQLTNLPLLNLNVSPTCILSSYILNTQHIDFMSLGRMIDLYKLHDTIQPLLQQLKSTGINLSLSKQLLKLLLQCTRPGYTRQVEQLYNDLLNSTDLLLNNQLLLIHNKMNILNGDMIRLCQCGVQTPGVNNNLTLAPQCTNCI